jgi:hypothetical protein
MSVKGGPVMQLLDNVFTGAADDTNDNNESDVYIEGNLFMNADDYGGHGAPAAITTGAGGSGPANAYTQHITVVRNIFYNNGSAIQAKSGAWVNSIGNVFINNDAAFLFDEPSRTDSGGCRFAYVENCIFLNTGPERTGTTTAKDWGSGTFANAYPSTSSDPLYVSDLLDGHTQLIVNNSLFPAEIFLSPTLPAGFLQSFTGNIAGDPRFVRVPDLANPVFVNPSLGKYRAGFPGFAAGGYLLGSNVPDVRLLPNSPALGAGLNGVDMGFYESMDATIGGAPRSPTYRTDATLTVAGQDITGYKFKVEGPGQTGVWSGEIAALLPATAISVNGLVVTLTVANHGYATGDLIDVRGADRECYNGTYAITVTGANTFTYAVAQADAFQHPGMVDIWVRKPKNITLTDLTDGTYTVSVIRKNVKGEWQSMDDNKTTKAAWTVDTSLAPHVRINEIMASNVSAVNHAGTYPDMIELFNDGQGTVDLSGMSLTDNKDVPAKFVFPVGTTIPQGGYLVVYADSAATSGLHTGFGLKADGGGLIDSVVFGVQLADKSIARKDDGTWGLAAPTFGATDGGGVNVGAANNLLYMGDPSTLKINEWLATEKVTRVSDFLELYNPDPLPVDMGGLYLTNVPASFVHQVYLNQQGTTGTPAPYVIPALSFIDGGVVQGGLKIGAYTVFTADGNTAAGANHVDFDLSAFQGMIGLFTSGAKPIDVLYYGPQRTDISQGRTPLGSALFATSSIPTPGLENTGITYGATGATITTPLIGSMTQTWNYLASATNPNLGTAWYQYSYPAGELWPSGPGLLYLETNSAVTPRTTAIPPYSPNKPYGTYYFRTHFTFSGNPADVTSFTLTGRVDDGALLYLNGVPFYNIRMPTSGVVWGTYTLNGEMPLAGDATADEVWTVTMTPEIRAALRVGDNVLSAEVHQCNSSSTDVVWGCKLDVLTTTGVTVLRQVTLPANIQALAANLRITEVMYNAVGGSDYEYVEFKNTSATTTLDLAGVRTSNGVDYVFSDTDPAHNLAPGQYIVVAANQTKFRNRYGSAPVLAAGVYIGKLSDNGENITLELPAPYDVGVLRFDYQPTWYPTASGGGHSIVIVDPTAQAATWEKRLAWKASTAVNGSPGAAEPAPSVSTVIITELMTHSDQDPPAGPGDWIELYNTSDIDPVVLTGWWLSDSGANLQMWQITNSTVLQPHEYKVFTERDDFGVAFALSELGDEVHLTDSSGAIHEIANFTAGDREVTFGRYTNSIGVVEYVPMAQATPGLLNSGPMVGPVVISEIMYHPAAAGDEFIELRNTTGADVPLYDINNLDNGWMFTNGIEFAFDAGDFVPAGGYALVVGGDPAAFRDKYGVPASVPIYGPYIGNLDNNGATLTLKKPGDEHADGTVPYYLVDHVLYNNTWSTR